MDAGTLARRRALAIEEIAAKTHIPVDDVKGPNVMLHQLFVLERLAEQLTPFDVEGTIAIISEVPGVGPSLLAKIKQALEEEYGR